MISELFVMNKKGLELTAFSDMCVDGTYTGCKQEREKDFKK